MRPSVFTYDRGIARAVWEEPARVEMRFDHVRTERRTAEASAEITVLSGSDDALRLLHRTRLNLISTRSRTETARYLESRMRGPDWAGLLEVASWKVLDAHRRGRPAILLRDAQQPPGAGVLLRPLLLARDPVVIFGDGGAAKSYLALALALCVHTSRELVSGIRPTASMRTAYLDFEWQEWPHRKRMRALWGGGELPDLVYVPCQAEGPLSNQVDRLRTIFHEHRIEYAVIDSVALACDGAPEEAQVAMTFFQALARLEVGSVLLAHVNRQGDTEKPFGSAFWHNSARATWYVQKVQEAGGQSLDLALRNRKANDGALATPLGLHFDFAENRTMIARTDGASILESAPDGPLKERIAGAVRSGPLTYAELGQTLQVDPDVVRITAKRYEGDTFTLLPPAPGSRAFRVALRATREQPEHLPEHPSQRSTRTATRTSVAKSTPRRRGPSSKRPPEHVPEQRSEHVRFGPSEEPERTPGAL
jgi:AAA domain